MLSRRSFVAALVALPVVVSSAPAAPAWWIGETVSKAGPREITAKRFGGRTIKATLISKVTPKTIELMSTANDNSTFTMWVVFPKQKNTHVFVSIDGEWFMSDSYGHDDTASQASFQLDRATAQRLAKALNVTLHERSKIDAGLRATWAIPARASTDATAAIPVKLRVKNEGKTTLGFVIGGRQRGPRDNRFSFTVSRNGKPVPIKDAPDFGGISYYKKLAPGDEHELTVDLRSWAELGTPGMYQIDAKYEGELAKDGVMPSTAAERKNLWDVSLAGQGGILVQ
ncbi:MAG: hypothetical protein H0T46_19070 [Deltaproteobacteria bacterium]|nr:hypothetical protein [Deltaproteobacteria bacterium]